MRSKPSSNRALAEWVEEVARLTRPQRIAWCDGSEEEQRRLADAMVADGTLIPLDAATHPGSYLHRSDPSDVARTEKLTFICSERESDCGPTNNWMSPAEARRRLLPLFDGAMRGRTMYVVPYVLGPYGSPFSRAGVEITDSPYVVASLRIMTRMGARALAVIGDRGDFCRGLHALGDLSPDRRYIAHFPETRTIWSVGSGYGGNALLSKKCFALRIAGVMARDEGWLAEHMMIIGVETPRGETHYLAAAFPSACGKTNLSMLVPPDSMPGYRVTTIGDDIAWLRFGVDGRLWAVNPEHGFFGVLPGTSARTNANALATIRRNTIFTNAALTPDGQPWWEGLSAPPQRLVDWQGRAWTPASGTTAAHPNARFTAPLAQCPSLSPRAGDPQGVPLSAILFGGRRAKLAPLVFQSFGWRHGVYVGAAMASETTAAQSGAVGVVRRDPMAMRPFIGYHVGDYFAHWLAMEAGPGGGRAAELPAIFHVNWFRTGPDGRFLWPGFGHNLRVLKWIIDRVTGRAGAVESPIGYLPRASDIDIDRLDIDRAVVEELLAIDRDAWLAENDELGEFLAGIGSKLPREIAEEHARQRRRIVAPGV